jgi:hypothetical protein
MCMSQGSSTFQEEFDKRQKLLAALAGLEGQDSDSSGSSEIYGQDSDDSSIEGDGVESEATPLRVTKR